MSHHHEGAHPHHGHGATPTQVLMEEHELILQALDALQKRLDTLQQATAADRAYFEKAVEFLRGFADQCHHGKEETLLFTRMGERGFPTQGGPIAVMLSEHQTGRAFIRGLAEATAGIGTDPTAGDRLRTHGYGYIALLRNHIAKENQVLFPMADRALSAADQHDLQQAFQQFEAEETGAGVHQRMLVLLAELKAEAH